MNLNRYDVVSVLAEAKKVTPGKTFTVEEFANAIGSMIQNRTNAPYLEWSKAALNVVFCSQVAKAGLKVR